MTKCPGCLEECSALRTRAARWKRLAKVLYKDLLVYGDDYAELTDEYCEILKTLAKP